MESQKPCRKVESETSDRKIVSKKKKGRKKNIDSKKDKEKKNKDSHSGSKKEKSTGDKLFLKKVYSKLTKFYEMFRGAVLKTKRSIICFCIFIPNDTSGMDEMQEILVISQTELQDFTNLECLTTLRLRSVYIPCLSGESPEESYEDTESVENGSENCSDTRTQEQIGPTCESNSEGVQGNSNTHGESSQMVCERSSTSISSSISSSGNDQENCLGRSDQNLMDSSVYIPSLSEESPEESHGDTESVVDRSDNFSDTRTQELFGLTCKSNCKGVQLNSMAHDEFLKMVNERNLTDRLPSTSLSGNDQENSLDRTNSFFRMDKMQEILGTLKTELQPLNIAECLTALGHLCVYIIPLIGESPGNDDSESVVNGSENCSETRTIVISERFEPTCESNCEGGQGNSSILHSDIMLLGKSSSISSSANLGRSDQYLKGIRKDLIKLVTIQTELQPFTEALGNLMSYSVVNFKVHRLEKAHALNLDSNVVVGLIKSSFLPEIRLDISFISDSLVHKSQPVTLQTFQGIMQRMGLPENPQLYEQLENSYTTNDSEQLSNVVIFAKDCRMFYYFPVLKGSLLQRKDAREREEPVNPWTKLLTVNTRTPGQQHLLDQSLKSDDHVTKSAQEDGVLPHKYRF